MYPHLEGDLLQYVQDNLGHLYYAGSSGNTLKAVKLKDIRYSGADDPLEHVNVYYDLELDQYIIQVTDILAEYTLTISDGGIDDNYNDHLVNVSLAYEDGAWTVLNTF